MKAVLLNFTQMSFITLTMNTNSSLAQSVDTCLISNLIKFNSTFIGQVCIIYKEFTAGIRRPTHTQKVT